MTSSTTTPQQQFDLGFLDRITYRRMRLHFTPLLSPAAAAANAAAVPPSLPPFPGSALRGAFGHAFRQRLCFHQPGRICELSLDCAEPDQCDYFRLFERSRAASNTATGSANVIKPYILEPPIPTALEDFARAEPDSTTTAAATIPDGHPLINNIPIAVPRGFTVGFTLLGQATGLAPAVIDLLRASSPLRIGPFPFALTAADEGQVQHLSSSSSSSRRDSSSRSGDWKITLLTPCRLRADSKQGGDYRLQLDHASSRAFASQFWQAALVRAMRVHDQLCVHSPSDEGRRLPRIEFPERMLPQVSRTRLWRYCYERLSNRQHKKMDFDGLIGSIWYQGGDAQALEPLVRAAEVLHIGQKATFGLGRVEGRLLLE